MEGDMMKKGIFWFFLSFLVYSNAHSAWITLDREALEVAQKLFPKSLKADSFQGDLVLVEFPDSKLDWLSLLMHHDLKRCGGFVHFENREEAEKNLFAVSERAYAEKGIQADYSIDQQPLVRRTIAGVKESRIRSVIEKMSSFHNRYYDHQNGVDSQKWLKKKWETIVAGRSDATVEMWEHSRWKQPSVMLTIQGESDEIIVVGGHADSIAGFWNRSRARAPGADDNASGIATITEIIQVIVDSGYQPKKTLKFFGYAAEEVGLRGSQEIASQYKEEGKPVIGVMQLDMTNFPGDSVDLVIISDYTNQEQNQFIGNLINEYQENVTWSYDKCGYACSDHASWHNQGFAASTPFEAKKREMNPNIHTDRDTISRSRGTANHATTFAKIGLSFIIELDR